MSLTYNINLYNGMLGSDRYQKCVYDMCQKKLSDLISAAVKEV